MSSPPPSKPPRGVKQGKETSGLLMSVIRTLSASETNEQREKERAKLEKEYKKSDVRLDKLVAEHASEIMEVMQKFNLAGAALGAWGQHCGAAVARLATCQSLLQLRRDDLRRLWQDARTHHYALQMLTDIERVVTSEREARSALAAGRVLSAASTLRAAIDVADTSLRSVDAVAATRRNLENKKLELVDVVVKRLNEQVYGGGGASAPRAQAADILAELTKPEEVTDAYLQDVSAEWEGSLAEEERNFDSSVLVALEGLGVLEQHKEAAEKFKCQIQSELLEVIDVVSKRIIEEADVEEESEQDGDMQEGGGATETGPLARLVSSLAEEFRNCAARNKRLLQLWRAALHKHRVTDVTLHTDQHYWSAVQQVMQLLLTEYLEIESVTMAARRGSPHGPPAAARTQEYFAKKKVPRKVKLFRFTEAAPSAAPRAARGPRVAPASPALLYQALPAVHALAAHIETVLGGSECSLRAFLTDYVRCGESARLLAAARRALAAAGAAPHAPRERTTGDAEHPVIFRWALEAWRGVRACARGAAACGACGGAEAARAALAAAAGLAAAARARRPDAQPDARAHRWLADDDIVRFLQSLPNWRAATSREPVPEDRQFAQELSAAYSREAEILGSSLGDGAPSRREVVASPAALIDQAASLETMEWLASKVRSLPSIITSGSGVKLNDKFLADVEASAQIFEDIAHKSLLFLHLELRIQCFHYLCAGAAGAGEEGAGGGGRLAAALLAFHEQATPVLNPKRMAYIMNGLGEMMSAAVIWRWQGAAAGAAGAGAGAGAPLGALRHCLAALRLEPAGLHAAANYAALLDATPEQIIQSIKEKGPQFSELEYLNAFKVIAARRSLPPPREKALLQQLSAALGHTGVTV